MLFPDGVYIDSRHGTNPRFRRVKAPTSDELTKLTHTIARRIGRYLERRGLMERDLTTGSSYTSEGTSWHEVQNIGNTTKVYEDMFQGHKPSRTTISINQNPLDALVEIECMAELRN